MKKKILIIDDSPDIIFMTQNLLELKGYEVLSVQEGLRAIEMVRSTRPDLILLDLILPDKNGCDICHEIKSDEQTKKIPIIVTTGHAPEAQDDLELLGPDVIMNKPFEPYELLDQVERLTAQ